jgi:hypothetical protein
MARAYYFLRPKPMRKGWLRGVKEQIMKSAVIVVIMGSTLMLAACNRSEQDRTTSISSALTEPKVELSAPAAPADRGATHENATASVPNSAATVALATTKSLPSSKGGAPEDEAINVRAQQAAATAPDTASADAAKKNVLNEAANTGGANVAK